ncbi:MAG: CBS domain-containing protein [Chloroflexota bacterium]|nr:CBS domain-containing protein [Chloroflexota bacterium]
MSGREGNWAWACRRIDQLTVADVDRLMDIEPILVQPHESLPAVVRQAVDHPGCSVVAVVDAQGRLLGLLPTRDLTFGAYVHVMPEIFLARARDLGQSGEFGRLSHGRTAGEVMRPPHAVRADEHVAAALSHILAAGLDGLPIVDAANRVVGYLSLLEFLCSWINSCYHEELLPPLEGPAPVPAPVPPRERRWWRRG